MKTPRSVLVSAVVGLVVFPFFVLASPVPYESSLSHVDSRIVDYNFSMASPVSLSDTFSLNVSLERPPSWYEIHSFVSFAIDFQSYGPYGRYDLDIQMFANGLPGPKASLANVWASAPYGLTLSGELPRKEEPSNFTGLRQGANLILLEFQLRSSLESQGSGYYHLTLGPFTVLLRDDSAVLIINLGFAGVVTLVTFPISYALGRLQANRRRKTVQSR